MERRRIVIGSVAMALLAHMPLARASTGTILTCEVRDEPTVKVYMDSTGHTVALEQKGAMSPDILMRNGIFSRQFSGAYFVFKLPPTSGKATLTIKRGKLTRAGTCS